MNTYRKTTLKIIALFSAAIFASFIPELFPTFFGDWVCAGNCDYMEDCMHKPTNHWGWRHWLFLMMGIVLFFIMLF